MCATQLTNHFNAFHLAVVHHALDRATSDCLLKVNDRQLLVFFILNTISLPTVIFKRLLYTGRPKNQTVFLKVVTNVHDDAEMGSIFHHCNQRNRVRAHHLRHLVAYQHSHMVLMEPENWLVNNLESIQFISQCEKLFHKKYIVKGSKMLITCRSMFC